MAERTFVYPHQLHATFCCLCGNEPRQHGTPYCDACIDSLTAGTIPCASCHRWPTGQCLCCNGTGRVPASSALPARDDPAFPEMFAYVRRMDRA